MTTPAGARIVHALGGPAAFLLLVLLPLESVPYPIRASIGLLIWMSWWWITQPVHLAVTGFLPLAVLSVFDFLPVAQILPAYSQQLVILLLGANMLATLWSRWGLDRRIALVSLLGIGTSTRQQILAWFAIATVLSTFLPNTVVAAAMMPIVVAMLRYIGIEEIDKSTFGSAVLIAVAWGTSVGGAGTPMGGAPNLLTVQFLERELIDHEFLFTTWLTRLMPLTILCAIVALLYLRFAFKPEMDRVEGAREYFKRQLQELGRLSTPEKWGLALFGAATLLAFTRGLYASLLPGLAPAYAFLAFGLLGFVLRHRGEPLLTWEYAQPRMVWGLIYLFAGGSALGQVLSQTGTAQFLADRLLGLASGGGVLAVGTFVVATLVLTQITSNTAAIAIAVPIAISTFQSLGLNPVPIVYLVAAAGNQGLMLPSSSGGSAIAAGYGVNLGQMFTAGFKLTLLIGVTIVIGGYLLARFWPGFGVA
jgi:solute carrier family 13 (sodium-dependent dicarboxylate transporter), member 2/3/5